jgi:hypothetical protein
MTIVQNPICRKISKHFFHDFVIVLAASYLIYTCSSFVDYLLLKFPGKYTNGLKSYLLLQGADLFFRSVLSKMQQVYLSRNPTAEKILGLVHSYDGDNICFDHFAFRTFGVSTSLKFSCL